MGPPPTKMLYDQVLKQNGFRTMQGDPKKLVLLIYVCTYLF